jgi:hypothetical protein
MPARFESLAPLEASELNNRQGKLIFNTDDHHVFTLTCHQSSEKSVVKDSGIGSNQYKTKPMKMIDMKYLDINKKENDLKSALFEDLYRKISMDQLSDPQSLSEKTQLPLKETLAIYKGDLKKLSTYMLLHALTQFGYDINICMRPREAYTPGSIYFE